MPAYTTFKNIESYYMGLDFSASDIITTAKVKGWISDHSVQLDSIIRRRYNLPIVNTNDLILLKLITEKMVVGKIDTILRLSSNEEEQKYVRNRNYEVEAKNMLQDLIDGKTTLETAQKCLSPIKYQKGNYCGN
jgi:hypothetical protein